VEDTSVFANQIVKNGQNLGRIAKQYYGNVSKYTVIFKAHTNILKIERNRFGFFYF
jgi:hypothetical protein